MPFNYLRMIRVLKPEDALVQTMDEMRSWLDKHGVQPVEFKFGMTAIPGIAFDLLFQSETEAVLFEQAFAPQEHPVGAEASPKCCATGSIGMLSEST